MTTFSTDDFKYLSDEINYYCNDNQTLCRICLEKTAETKKMFNIFQEGGEPLSSMIMACASIQIIQGDGLPNTICHKCLAKLNVAWQFKVLCENSDLKLRQYCQAPLFAAHPNVNLSKSAAFSAGNSDPLNTVLLNQPAEGITKNENSNDGTNQKKPVRGKEAKIHQCDTCGKIFNRREYLTQHIRIHTGEKPYCCHICEKRFINSGHLTTHMRTHTGERPHACSLCPKSFSTRQELHKHTMVHKGLRPFVCTTCGKCFGSSSNLYSHLRHHTGEKNFTCEHCGKAFYTKQELKQHLVVHTGVKAFCCQFCNKRFSQSAHLRRHLKLHNV